MTPPSNTSRAQPHELSRELTPVQRSEQHLTLEEMKEVKLRLTADLGRCRLQVREVLELQRGSVLALDKLAGEMADIHVNGVPLARGEIIVLGDSLHVRVAEIHGAAEKDMLAYE